MPTCPSPLCPQTVFLLWNSLNDPLFGWLSDRQFLSSQPWFVSRGMAQNRSCPTHPSPGLEVPCLCLGDRFQLLS